jgi:dTDP-glucose 4,6-dehydratase
LATGAGTVEERSMRLLVTGGAGFIGSNFVRLVLKEHPDYELINLDKLTYAGNLANLRDVENLPNYTFVKGDIADPEIVSQAARGVDVIVNFAAETHVDRSIHSAGAFIDTDVKGNFVLLEEARRAGVQKVVCVSTDEVYGSIEDGAFTESDRLNPRNPYSASKAGGELLACAFYHTYDMPVVVTRGSNNYGPYQYPEKLIPLFVTNAIDDLPLPLYGDGLNVRDWLHVEDHCRGIEVAIAKGEPGEVYNIGADNQHTNIEITQIILDHLGKSDELIRYVTDRPGHDRRYAIDSSRLRALGWAPQKEFMQGIRETVDWYVQNEWWWRPLKSGEYLEYYKKQYGTI